jgi:hypothetical protein
MCESYIVCVCTSLGTMILCVVRLFFRGLLYYIHEYFRGGQNRDGSSIEFLVVFTVNMLLPYLFTTYLLVFVLHTSCFLNVMLQKSILW